MKITAIKVESVSMRVNPALAIVSAAGTHPESHYLVVTVLTDTDAVGYGEATLAPVWSGETQNGAAFAIDAILAPMLVGKDPRNVRALSAAMDRGLIGNPFTKAAVEMALLDIAARSYRISVSMLLGGSRREAGIPLKFSIGAFSPAEAARVAAHAIGLGLRSVKVKVGLDVRTDIERVAAVRAEIGDSVRIAVDANAGWTENDALRALPMLEKLGVNAFEQPLRRGEFRGTARIRARTSIPIMLDESIFTVQDVMQAIREDCCDLISIYPGKNGGILRSFAIAELAAAAGIECVIGSNLEMDLGTAAMLHLAVAIPALASSVGHDIIGPLYYEQHLTNPSIVFAQGCAFLPEGNGLGLEPSRSASTLNLLLDGL